jgi:hypothetical protein
MHKYETVKQIIEDRDRLRAENERLKELLIYALHHCETEGDDTLVCQINAALRGEEKK